MALLVPCPFFHPSSSRDLIFRPMSRGNSSFKLVSQDEPISYTTIREAFRKDLRSVGVDSSNFGFYSFRSRGAIWPLPLLVMGLVTVCFSGSSAGSPFKLRTPTDDDLEKRFSVSKFLGL